MSFSGLKILMISSDRNILSPESAVSERMKEYGNLVEELHIVLLSDASHKLTDQQLSKNVWVYPTNSLINFLRPLDATRIGKKVIFDKKFIRGKSLITTQDPFECGWAGMKIKNKWRIPFEVQLHTDPFSPNFGGFFNIIRKLIVRIVLRRADTVRVVAEYLRNKISRMTKARINVLPIYVDSERIESAKVSFDLHARFGWHFILLAVARLVPEKNLSVALEALALVYDEYPDTGLVIVGAGPEMNNLKALAKKLKISNAVEFVGWQDDIASYYKTANAFIQTSLFEGYGLSLIEAGFSGLPVLTTPVGIARELVAGVDAYIYPPNRPDLFAGGVLDLIRNNFKRESLRTNLIHTLKSKLMSKDDYMAKLKDIINKSL